MDKDDEALDWLPPGAHELIGGRIDLPEESPEKFRQRLIRELEDTPPARGMKE